MQLNKYIITIVCILFYSNGLIAQKSETPLVQWHVKGYLKALPTETFYHYNDSTAFLGIIHNRLNSRFDFRNNITARIEMRNRFFYGDLLANDFYKQQLATDKGLMDLTFNWFDGNKYVLNSTFDRMQLNWYNSDWDIAIGRQRVNWGIHNVWNPNDLFNAFNFLDFDYEERPGSDAVRVRYNFKNNTQLEIAAAAGNNFENNTAALMYRFNTHTYDVQILGGMYKTDIAAGIGWAGNIWTAGFKGEFTYFQPHENFADTSGSISFSTGIDYSFKNGLYLNVSYLYNTLPDTSGVNNFQLYGVSDAKQLMPFEHTFFAQLSYPFNPLFMGSVAVFYEPVDNSIILFPTISYSVADNFTLSFIAQSFIGKYIDYKPLSTTLFLDAKWFFSVQ